MSYQKCPICGGSGEGQFIKPTVTGFSGKCNTCSGTGIISELTGLPPKKEDISEYKAYKEAMKDISENFS